jgi:hypothetical protein
MSVRQLGTQACAVLGGPLGGIVVATIGLAAAAVMNSATYAVMFVVLLLPRPWRMTEPAAKRAATDESRSLLLRALDGLKLTARDPLLRAALVVLIGTAGFLLPVIVPLVPILARQQGWAARQAGAVAGASGLGTALVAIAFLVRGGFERPGLANYAGAWVVGVCRRCNAPHGSGHVGGVRLPPVEGVG